jgi:GT2 family glycosyltransferase
MTAGIATVSRPLALARCLDAILAGSVLPEEIIVVDQGGDIATVNVITERLTAFPGLRHIRQPRTGLSAARNHVVRLARSPVVAVTDDDCVPDREWLAAISRAFDASPRPDAVSGRVLALPETGANTYAISLRTSTVTADFVRAAIPWHAGTGANFAVRRDLILRIGGYDERFGVGSSGQAAEDVELLVRLLRSGARIRYTPDAVVFHERQTRARRLATRWSYSYGIGALGGMLCRQRDRQGITILRAALADITRRMLREARARNTFGVRQAFISLSGTAHGIRYGWGLDGPARRAIVPEGTTTA